MTRRPGNWSHWRIDAVGIALVAAATLLAVMFGFLPVVDQRLDRAEQQERAEEQRKQAEAMAAASERLRTQLGRVEEAIEQSELRLQPVRQLNRRVAGLADLAEACGLDVDQIQPSESVRGERYEQVPIQLAGEADYAACAVFVHRLAQRFPDVTLTVMELQAASTPGGRVTRFRFGLSWHAAATATAASGPASGDDS